MVRKLDIAIIGAGISGIAAAHHLQHNHRVTLFEQKSQIGGHANTVRVKDRLGEECDIDTGFIVFNDKNYPLFSDFLSELKVSVKPTDMSFSYTNNHKNISYAGTPESVIQILKNPSRLNDIKTLFNIYRYSKALKKTADDSSLNNISIREHLLKIGCPPDTIEHYFVPIASAIWSCDNMDSGDIPANAYINFFNNHGLLGLFDRPHWYTITGGSKEYINNFKGQFKGDVVTDQEISNVQETDQKVTISCSNHATYDFDKVIMATHADTTLQIVTSLPTAKSSILESHRYTHNNVFLHTDANLMPNEREVWACWNAISYLGTDDLTKTYVSYFSNRLQKLNTKTQFFITLNPPTLPKDDCILYETTYSHPVLVKSSNANKDDFYNLNKNGNILFCGAYLGYGFHEDGFRSGKLVADILLQTIN